MGADIESEDGECGFAPDLHWIQGWLRHEEIEGGFWRCEFGGDDAPHGGSVVLGNPEALGGLEDGTLVRLEGAVDPDRITFFMAGTFYEVTHAREAHA